MEAKKVQTILGQMQKSLECSICLEMMSNPVSTNCGHQFCRFCLMECLERKKQVPCPLCKKTITKRSLTEREQLGNIVGSIRQLITAFQTDTGELFSPPRGSQANIIPSTPEPSQPSSSVIREQTDATKPRSRTRKKNTGAEPGSTSNLRSVPAGKANRRNSRGKAKETTVTVPADLDPSTDELLRCIAEGIQGGAEGDADTSEGTPDVRYKKQHRNNSDLESAAKEATRDEPDPSFVEDSKVDNVIDAEPISIETFSVTNALLEMIETGSHGAMHSNSGDVQERIETQESAQSMGSPHNVDNDNTEQSMDIEADNDDYHSAQSIEFKANEEDKHLNKQDIDDVILLSGVSDNDYKDIEASGNTGSGQYSLFRTPIDPKTVGRNNKKVKSVTADQARPRRACRSKDASHESEDNDGNEISDLLANEESDFEEPEFLNEPKIQHTYNRKNKPNKDKDSASSNKVAEWLKNIPATESEANTKNKKSETVTHCKKGRKKAEKVQQEEGVMGQRIKHLAEKVQHTHKDLLFNGDDFASSQKSISKQEDVGNEVLEIKDTGNNVVKSSADVNCTETEVDDIPTVASSDVEVNRRSEDADCISKADYIDTKMETETLPVQHTGPLKRKRIFKTKLENKVTVSQPSKDKASVDERLSDEKEQAKSSSKQEHSKQTVDKTVDPFEFVSSQNTPVKPAKGKKKTKPKSTNNKKKPLSLSTYNGKFTQSTKTDKTIDSFEENSLNETKITTSQNEINKVSATLNQAESYDLLTCTQEAAKEFTNEKQLQRNTNKKKVSFREPLISDFIQQGKIDIVGYRKAKADMEDTVDKKEDSKTIQSDTSRTSLVRDADKDNSRGEKRASEEDILARAVDVGDSKDSEKDKAAPVSSMENGATGRPEDSDDDASDDVSEDWRFHDNSSGTDDLDIEPGETEYEQPDLDIQPDEIQAKLSQAEFEKNILMKSQETQQLKSPKPEPSIIGETPVMLTGPHFSDKAKSRNKIGSKTKDIDTEHLKTAETSQIEETPLIFAVPKFSKETESKGTKSSKSTDNQQGKLTPEEQSVVEETPLLFTVPKFNEKSRRRNGKKSKTIEGQTQMSDSDARKEATVPETPVLTFGSLDDASESLSAETEDLDEAEGTEEQEVEAVEDLETLPPETSTEHAESSEETQAPSLEIIVKDDVITDVAGDSNSGEKEKAEFDHKLVEENASLICDPAEPSLNSNLTDTQESASILITKPKGKNQTVSPHKANESDRVTNKAEILPCDSNQSKSDNSQKSGRGKKRKGKGKGAGKSKQSSSETISSGVSSESCDVTVIELDEKETNKRTRSTRRVGRNNKTNLGKGSECYQPENVEEDQATCIEVDNDRELDGNSQVSVISVASATQRSVQLTEEKLSVPSKGKTKSISIDDSQEGLAKSTDTGVNSLSMVPDSVIDEDQTQMPETKNKHDAQTVSQTIGMDVPGSMSKKSSRKNRRSLTKRNSSVESFRQRNLSGVLNSPQSSNIFNSPENIFAEDSEMPVVESSPFDETLQPCYLSDDEVVVSSKSKSSQQAVAVVTTNLDNNASSDDEALDTDKTLKTKSKSQKGSQDNFVANKSETQRDSKTSSQESVRKTLAKSIVQKTETGEERGTSSQEDPRKGKDVDDAATPSPRNKRRSKTARGFAKRQRMLDVGSGDSNLSSLRSPASTIRSPSSSIRSPAVSTKSPAVSVGSPASNIPTTPTASTAKQYKSPATKYMSPKTMVSHNLPLIGQSPLQSKTMSPAENKFLTPSKRNVLSTCSAKKYSPSVRKRDCTSSPSLSTGSVKKNSSSGNKHREVEDNNTYDSPLAEVVEVNVGKDGDEESETGTPGDLPDIDLTTHREIQSSLESATSNASRRTSQKTRSKRKRNVSSDSRDSGRRPVNNTNNQQESSEIVKDTNDTCSVVSDSYRYTTDEVSSKPQVDEKEIEAVNETRSSAELNLDSSREEMEAEKVEKETEECPSSPEFKLESSDDEEDLQVQALKEINNFNEIKEHAECLAKSKTSTSSSKPNKAKACSPKRSPKQILVPETLEDDNRFSTNLDSSPIQPEVIQESDVESNAGGGEEETSEDSEDEVVRRKNVKKAVIDSSSDEDDENSRHMNLTSSSAFSSQSENLSTQEKLALEDDLDRMKREMRIVKEQLKQNKKSIPMLSLNVDDDSDDAMIEADDTGDEMDHQELYASPPPVSPAAESQEVTDRGGYSEVEDEKGDYSKMEEAGKGGHLVPDGNNEDSCRVTEKGDNEEVDRILTESQMETMPPSLPAVPDSLPGQRSALKDLDPNVMETRKQPGEQKLINIIASGLSASQIQEVKKLAAVNNIKYYNKFSRSVTHVIVKSDPDDDLLCDRTLKFFQGVANKCWIVNQKWAQESKEVGHLLPEGRYEIWGDTANGTAHQGPRLSRLSKDKLFLDMEFALIGDNAYLSKDSLRDLIEMCGGWVTEAASMDASSEKCFVVSCTDVEDEDSLESQQIIAEAKSLYKRHRLLTLTREWILDSITMYSLQPLQEYVVTKVKNARIPLMQ